MNISVLEEEAESKHKISSWGTWGCDVSWSLIGCWTAMHNGLQISFPLGQIIMASSTGLGFLATVRGVFCYSGLV